MLHTFNSSFVGHWPGETEAKTDHQFTTWIVGTAASGLDLVANMTLRLWRDKADAVHHYALQSEALATANLRPQNRRALALHEAWFAEPDDLGPEWWAEFEQDLEQHHLTFREF